MVDALDNFFKLVENLFYQPIFIALNRNSYIIAVFNSINSIINSILGIESFFTATSVAGLLSLIIIIWLFIFIYKIFRYCFNLTHSALRGIIDKYSWRKEWRRKK